MKKLKLTHVNTLAREGGAAKFMHRLSAELQARGHEACILTGEAVRDGDGTYGFDPSPDAEARRRCRENGWLDYDLQGSHRLVDHELIRASDLLHFSNLHGGYFNPWSLSALSHLKPAVWTLHDMQSITGHCAHSFQCEKWQTGCGDCPGLRIPPELAVDSTARLIRDKAYIYDRSCLQIVVPSDWLRKKVEKSILRDHPVELIYNGCDTDTFRPYDTSEIRQQFNIPPRAFVIGASANAGVLANPWKGGHYTLEVLQLVRKTIPGAVFLNIGAAKPSGDPFIINIPPIRDENRLARLYSALDVFLYTPVADTCPLVVIEMLACGVPIVTCDTGGVPELVRDKRDGFVFPIGQIPPLLYAIRALHDNPPLAAMMRQNARQAALERFTVRQMADRYLDLYRRCIETHPEQVRRAKCFDLGRVPEVIRTDAFLRAEQVKTPGPQIVVKNRREYPKISVVTPSFNQGRYLEACIDSILSQDYPNLEYIIMDGGSTDNSVEIIKKYERHLTYWQSRKDGGQYAAIEAGFRRSTGSIMTWLNSDDVFLPEAFRRAAAIFLHRPEVRWIMSKTLLFNEDGTIRKMAAEPNPWCRAKYLRKEYKGQYIQQEGSFWRRDLWEQAGARLRTEMRLAGDLELWTRFFRHAQLYSLDEYMAGFRVQPSQKTSQLIQQYNEEAEQVLDEEIRQYLAAPPEQRAPLLPPPEPISSVQIREYLEAVEEPSEPPVIEVPRPASGFQVSAIVSVYNAERFIRGCLRDLVNQTLYRQGRMEIVIINSGSGQNEDGIIEKYRRRYPNIQYIRTPQRETVYQAWNRGVRAATGRYLTNANTDDRHRPDALEIMAGELDRHPGVGLVYTDQVVSRIPNATFPRHHGDLIAKPDYSPDRLRLGCCVGSQPMWRKSMHDEFGLFDETLTVAADWDFWLRIASKYPLRRIPGFLGLYYNNESGVEHGQKIHSLYERWLVGKRFGTPYIATIPVCTHPDNPLVSIVMPAWNAADTIREAIESVLIQNYQNIELVIVNDGSTDRTEQAVRGFDDRRIRYFAQTNAGPSAARNQAVRRARGACIVILDSDDMLTPDFVARHLEAFGQHPEADLVYCDDLLMDAACRPLRVIERREYARTDHLIRDLFQAGFPVIPFRTCIRRSVFERIGYYDESLRVGEDYDMLRRFIRQGLVARHLPGAFYLRRLSAESQSRNSSPQKACAHYDVMRRYLETFDCTQLFPDLPWTRIPPEQREYYARFMAARVFAAIGEEYEKTGSSPFLIRGAFEAAAEQIAACRRIGPDQPGVRELLEQCRRRLDSPGIPRETAIGRRDEVIV